MNNDRFGRVHNKREEGYGRKLNMHFYWSAKERGER